MNSFLICALLIFGESLVSKGDAEYTRLNYTKAESLYVEALAAAPNDPDILWRLARLTICKADISPSEKREQLYRNAETFAKMCISVNEQKAEGHTWLAGALGNIAMFEGGETKVSLARDIRSELSRALELNPNDDVAYSILGSFYRALGSVSWIERQLANLLLGGLPEGGYLEAEAALKKAIALAPNVMRHHYELGMLYLDCGRETEAREELLQTLKVPFSVKSDSTRIAEIKIIVSEHSQ